MTMERQGRASPLNIPADDLQRCHEVLGAASWRELAGQRLLLTGGTGFVGKWLLGTLLDADDALELGCRITVLSRDPSAFMKDWPGMMGRVDWLAGDVRDFDVGAARFDMIVHAATDVVTHASPQEIFMTCLEGTRRVLELAHQCGTSRLMLVSSGAIYGPLPAGMTHVPETHLGGPDPLLCNSAYGEGTRVSEWLSAHAAGDNLSVTIARVFALVGPHMPLDKHFAIGNFLRAAMSGEDIVIQGDGTPHRSYLHAADMAAWLWAILLKGRSGEAYNVGAQDSISIGDLATRVCRALKVNLRIMVREQASPGAQPVRYVPDCRKAMEDLGLPPPMALDEAIVRTAKWHGFPDGIAK